jgi:hypothetical protein
MARSSYVEALIAVYMWVPGTPSRASRNDRRLAHSLEQRGVPLDTAAGAILLGAARRAFRSRNAEPLAPIRTLHYFMPVVEELLEHSPEPGYADYLRSKLAPLAKATTSTSIPTRLNATRFTRSDSRASS